jgi:hypothetical protein
VRSSEEDIKYFLLPSAKLPPLPDAVKLVSG